MCQFYKEEIEYRQQLIEKRCNKVKLTQDEKTWLSTHSSYNLKYDEEIYNTVIEKINPKQWYSLHLKIEYAAFEKIYPMLFVPESKGNILTDFDVYNIKGILKKNRDIKMLVYTGASDVQLKYRSSLGCIAICYECEYFDPNQKIYLRTNSGTGVFNFAIKREKITDNAIRYRCKNPLTNDFDALVFTVEMSRDTNTEDASPYPSPNPNKGEKT